MSLNEDDQADNRNRDVPFTNYISLGGSNTEILESSEVSSFDSTYDQIHQSLKDSDSNNPKERDLNLYAGDDETILKRYPSELLDRVGRAASLGLEFHQAIKIDDVYAEVHAEDEECKVIIENEFGRSGLEARQELDDLKFEEYIAETGEEINFNSDPENVADADVMSEGKLFDDFFEGFTAQETCLVYSPKKASTPYS